MNKSSRLLFAFTSILLLTGCFSPAPSTDVVCVDFNNGAGKEYFTIPIVSTFAELAKDHVKRGCTLTHFEDQKGKKYSLDDEVICEDHSYKAVYTVNKDEITKETREMVEGHGDLRIMSYNVLSDDWNNKPQMHGYDAHNEKYPSDVDDGRDIQTWKTLQTYKPDVVGVQEFDDEWYSAFKTFKNQDESIPFEAVNENEIKYSLDGQQKTIYTTLLYNPETVTLKQWKHTRFKTADTNTNCRSYTYGIFESNESGDEFIVVSSHWNHLDSSLSTTAQKDKEQAEETAEVYKTLQEEYDCPIIGVGDMNQIDSHHSYKTLVDESGFKDAKYSAKERGLCCDTYHIGNGDTTEPGKWYRGIDSVLDSLINTVEARDHILLSQEIETLYYETVTSEEALNSSDHMPIFADINL